MPTAALILALIAIALGQFAAEDLARAARTQQAARLLFTCGNFCFVAGGVAATIIGLGAFLAP